MVIFLADQTVSAQSLHRAGRPGGLCQGSVGNCRIVWGSVGSVGFCRVLSACRPVGLSASVGLCRKVLTAHAHGDCRNLIIWHCRSLSVTVGLSDLSDCRTCRDCRVYVGVLSVKTVGLSDRGSDQVVCYARFCCSIILCFTSIHCCSYIIACSQCYPWMCTDVEAHVGVEARRRGCKAVGVEASRARLGVEARG